MRFYLLQEIDVPGGDPPPPERYQEVVAEAIRAEEVGWHGVALSEQHFNRTLATSSAPESFLGYVAARTETIRLRFASVVTLPFNHPIRVAERVATLDVLSGGRIELGTARSNNPTTLKTFGVSAGDTRALSTESLEIIKKALVEYPFEHHGSHYDIPPTTVNPRPIQQPHPPIHTSAASVETHTAAGRGGAGVMTGNSLPGGWNYLRESIAAYRAGQQAQTPETLGPGGMTVDCAGALGLVAHCATDTATAREEAAELASRALDLVATWFEGLAKQTTDYAALGPMREVVDRREDLDFLVERSPYLSIGDPDFFIERSVRLAELGYDEFLLRIDGLGHEKNLQAIELIGEHVIPAVSAAQPSRTARA
jgi:alkanesulfonate monooxygenase SsuD/methylene tetrahydromethanopterin reductase-like flavin-dependent oxidoreductase (luciferase family)